MQFSIGIRHVLEDCLKAVRRRPLDPERRQFALRRGLALFAAARRGHDAIAATAGLVGIAAEPGELEAYRFLMEHGGTARGDFPSDLASTEAALGGLARDESEIDAADLAAADELISAVIAAGLYAQAAHAMETI